MSAQIGDASVYFWVFGKREVAHAMSTRFAGHDRNYWYEPVFPALELPGTMRPRVVPRRHIPGVTP
jgi:hypothetical protein